jgi:cytidine deaminase
MARRDTRPEGAPAVSEARNALARDLVAAARRVRRHAHAPYSHFRVGAAVVDELGRIHVGCNVENASYGLTICAERGAVMAAVAAGARAIHGVAVVTGTRPPGSPCGACRQVLAELAGDTIPVWLAAPTGRAVERSVGALLPEAFRLARARRAKAPPAKAPPGGGGRPPQDARKP